WRPAQPGSAQPQRRPERQQHEGEHDLEQGAPVDPDRLRPHGVRISPNSHPCLLKPRASSVAVSICRSEIKSATTPARLLHLTRRLAGVRLRELREAIGLSQSDIAKLIGVGVATVSKW